jgi:L-threonylcarbamoyladenylate synthase
MEYSERPLTIIYEEARNLPVNLISSDGSIAIRVTRDAFCSQLISLLKKPIVSTSANISGEPSPSHFGEITEEILTGVDYIVNLRHDERKKSLPSAIIQLKNNGEIKFIRK